MLTKQWKEELLKYLEVINAGKNPAKIDKRDIYWLLEWRKRISKKKANTIVVGLNNYFSKNFSVSDFFENNAIIGWWKQNFVTEEWKKEFDWMEVFDFLFSEKEMKTWFITIEGLLILLVISLILLIVSLFF